MTSNKGRNTSLELGFRSALRDAGFSGYKLNYRVAGTRTDISYVTQRVAILVHGCFWHHCSVCNFPLPRSHRNYWARKFALTRIRDRKARHNIRKIGWHLFEVWEHEIKANKAEYVNIIGNAIESSSKHAK